MLGLMVTQRSPLSSHTTQTVAQEDKIGSGRLLATNTNLVRRIGPFRKETGVHNMNRLESLRSVVQRST